MRWKYVSYELGDEDVKTHGFKKCSEMKKWTDELVNTKGLTR
jgi:hypothetical protein